jgi:hypothetical protein
VAMLFTKLLFNICPGVSLKLFPVPLVLCVDDQRSGIPFHPNIPKLAISKLLAFALLELLGKPETQIINLFREPLGPLWRQR